MLYLTTFGLCVTYQVQTAQCEISGLWKIKVKHHSAILASTETKWTAEKQHGICGLFYFFRELRLHTKTADLYPSHATQ